MSKITWLSVSDKVSGGELYVLQLLGALKHRGHDVTLMGGLNSPILRAAEADGLRTVGLRLGPKLGRKTALQNARTFIRQRRVLRSALLSGTPDVVVAHYKLEQLLIGSIQKIQSKLVMVEHGPIPGAVAKLGPLRALYKRAAKLAHGHIAASLAAQRSLSNLGIKSALLHAGIDHERIRKAAQDAARSRAEIEAVVGRKMIGCYAGRIVENKGILDVVRCVLGDPNIGLVIVGDGPGVPQLEKMIGDGGGNVTYLGRVEDATPLIASADFGVLLTRDGGEGRPLFVTECAALGVPVIGTRASPVMRDMLTELGSSHIKLVGRAEEVPEMAGNLARTVPALLPSWEEQAKRFEDWVGIATRI